MSQEIEKSIQQFYGEADAILAHVWACGSQMIHFGYYPTGKADGISHVDSLIETVRQASLRLDLQPGQRLLDAGCGLGGPAVWFALNQDIEVHGISNVPQHVESASRHAARSGLLDSGRVKFSLLDYADTGLPSGSFDGVVAIESVCYAPETTDFLKEAFRLLKPGGRLVVLDGFRANRPLSGDDERLMKSWLSGWGAQRLDTVEEFCGKAARCGFERVKFEDLQTHFRPSHHECYRWTRFLCPGAWLLNRLHLLSDTLYGHLRASRDVWFAAERGLCLQGIAQAVKPLV